MVRSRAVIAAVAAGLVPGVWLSSQPAAATGAMKVFLANVGSGQCLSVPREGARSGSAVGTVRCSSERDQGWVAERQANELFRLHSTNAGRDLCLTVKGTKSGRYVGVLRGCAKNSAQEFKAIIVDGQFVIFESAKYPGGRLGLHGRSPRVVLLKADNNDKNQQWALFQMTDKAR